MDEFRKLKETIKHDMATKYDFEEIRINLGAMGTLDLSQNIMDDFYDAYTFFYKKLHSKRFQISFKLKFLSLESSHGPQLSFDALKYEITLNYTAQVPKDSLGLATKK